MTTSPQRRPIRIANCSGFFGDRIAAAREQAGEADKIAVFGSFLTVAAVLDERQRKS